MSLMFFIHHFVRVLWSYPLKFIFFLVYLFKDKDKQKQTKLLWDAIKSPEALSEFFLSVYKYKFDGFIGELDHDNPSNEFFAHFGDCDDMGRYSAIKLKELGYKATRIGILNQKNILSWHYDCIFEKDEKQVLFNYGNLIQADSIDECVKKLGEQWEMFAGDKVIWWKCNW